MKSFHPACFCLALALTAPAIRAESGLPAPAPSPSTATGRDAAPASRDAGILEVGPQRGSGKPCEREAKPGVPPIDWTGEVRFTAVATTQEGRVVSISVKIDRQSTPLPRASMRALVTSITDAMRAYQCQDEQVFSQTFTYRYPQS